MDSAEAFNKTKRDFLKLQKDFMDTVYFFHSTSLLTSKFEHGVHKHRIAYCDNLWAITRYIIKAILVIDKSKLFWAITIIDIW